MSDDAINEGGEDTLNEGSSMTEESELMEGGGQIEDKMVKWDYASWGKNDCVFTIFIRRMELIPIPKHTFCM